MATVHELKAIDRKALDCPFQIGIDIIALRQCKDGHSTHDEVLWRENLLTYGPQGRDPVDADLLESSPPFHRTPRFPKVLIDIVYNGSINGIVPFVFGEGDDGHYVEWAANQWKTDYCSRTGSPRLEAREPCIVLMYVYVRPKAQKDSRPSPTHWHWSLLNTAPQTPLTWIPDAVLVTCMVWIVATPEIAMNLEVDGKLIFCAFGE